MPDPNTGDPNAPPAGLYYTGSNARVQTYSICPPSGWPNGVPIFNANAEPAVGPFSWRLEKTVGEMENSTFATQADQNFVLHQDYLCDHLCSTMLTIESVINSGPTKTEQLFPVGTTIVVDLFFDKDTQVGYPGVMAFVRGYSPGVTLKDKQTVNVICRVTNLMPFTDAGTPPINPISVLIDAGSMPDGTHDITITT